jgi:lipopolysaccharide/colanic/teichoic acid biosynthesis glycosyltransferase
MQCPAVEGCPSSEGPVKAGGKAVAAKYLEVVLSTDHLLPSSIVLPHLGDSEHQSSPEKRLTSEQDEKEGDPVSVWARSGGKRLFDMICVLLSAPLILPICLCVAVAVRLTSRGPAIYRQQRSGLDGVTFTILKFRTMEHKGVHKAESTLNNQRFTSIGPFLRRWKLDELPQLLNVLVGDMSLVGPRPKMPQHQLGVLRSRPGITGAATLVFANEEAILASIPEDILSEFFQSTVLPAKLRLDQQYMVDATFVSDLELIVRTLFRRWDRDKIFDLLEIEHPRFASCQQETVHRTFLDLVPEEGASAD